MTPERKAREGQTHPFLMDAHGWQETRKNLKNMPIEALVVAKNP
jgi:hypothetical protein